MRWVEMDIARVSIESISRSIGQVTTFTPIGFNFTEQGMPFWSLACYKEIEYEEVEYDPPKVILGRLRALEDEIRADLDALEGLLS